MAPKTAPVYGFPKSARLLKGVDYLRASRKGKRRSTKSFIVFIFENGLDHSRLGLSVSTRVGSAPRRNRIKRLIREFFRLNREKFPVKLDIHVRVKDRAAAKSLEEVFGELGFLLKIRKEGVSEGQRP